MSTFIPFPGSLFYVSVKPRVRNVVESSGFNDVKVKTLTESDGSWREDIFRCVAKDETHLAALKLTGYREDKPQLFRLDNYTFSAVGPAIAKAMGFEVQAQEGTDTTEPVVQKQVDKGNT